MKKFDLVSKALNDLMFVRKTAMEQLPAAKKVALSSMNLDERAERRAKIKQIWDKFNRPFIYFRFEAITWSLDAELSLNCRDYWIYEYYTNPFNHVYLSKDDIKDVCRTYNVDIADLKEHRDYVVANLANDRYYDYYESSIKNNSSMLAWFPDIEEHVNARDFSNKNQQKFEQMCDYLHKEFFERLSGIIDVKMDGYEYEYDYYGDPLDDYMPKDSGDKYDWIDDHNWLNCNVLCIGDLLNFCQKYSIDYDIFRKFCLPIFDKTHSNYFTHNTFDDVFSPINLDKFMDVYHF